MNKKTIRLLNELQQLTERTAEVITELKKVDWSEFVKEAEKVTEKDIGKLCMFSDYHDYRSAFYAVLNRICPANTYPYYTTSGCMFSHCKRVKKEDLEGLL